MLPFKIDFVSAFWDQPQGIFSLSPKTLFNCCAKNSIFLFTCQGFFSYFLRKMHFFCKRGFLSYLYKSRSCFCNILFYRINRSFNEQNKSFNSKTSKCQTSRGTILLVSGFIPVSNMLMLSTLQIFNNSGYLSNP